MDDPPMKTMTDKIERRIFDAHFHIGGLGARTYSEQRITPLVTEHSDYRACAAYLQKHGISADLEGTYSESCDVERPSEEEHGAYHECGSASRADDTASHGRRGK